MRGKLTLLVGVGIGYVLGARAGRKRYEQMKRAVNRFWEDPRVQNQVQNVEDFARDKAPEVVDFLGGTAKKAVKKKSPTPKKTTSTKSAAATGTSKSTSSSKK